MGEENYRKTAITAVLPDITEDMASMIRSGNNKKKISKEQKGSSWKLKT